MSQGPTAHESVPGTAASARAAARRLDVEGADGTAARHHPRAHALSAWELRRGMGGRGAADGKGRPSRRRLLGGWILRARGRRGSPRTGRCPGAHRDEGEAPSRPGATHQGTCNARREWNGACVAHSLGTIVLAFRGAQDDRRSRADSAPPVTCGCRPRRDRFPHQGQPRPDPRVATLPSRSHDRRGRSSPGPEGECSPGCFRAARPSGDHPRMRPLCAAGTARRPKRDPAQAGRCFGLSLSRSAE